jgi:putative tricarboxylic transport membrane protein
VYCIIALILLWPLVRRFLPRKAVPSVLEEAAHQIEEAHQHTGLTTAVSVERHVGDRRTESRNPPRDFNSWDGGDGG